MGDWWIEFRWAFFREMAHSRPTGFISAPHMQIEGTGVQFANSRLFMRKCPPYRWSGFTIHDLNYSGFIIHETASIPSYWLYYFERLAGIAWGAGIANPPLAEHISAFSTSSCNHGKKQKTPMPS